MVPALHDRPLKVLVVDDEPLTLRVVARMFERLKAEVHVATSAEDAEALVREHRFDLLVSDVVMPQMHGPDLTALLQEVQPDLPVIYTSGYSRDHVAEYGVRDEDEFLEKPLSLEQLSEAVEGIMSGGSDP